TTAPDPGPRRPCHSRSLARLWPLARYVIPRHWLWGLHMGLTQGVLAALAAAMAPKHLRGTAFGLFGLITGRAALGASLLAGTLWDVIGPTATFGAGAGFAAAALAGFLLLDKPQESSD